MRRTGLAILCCLALFGPGQAAINDPAKTPDADVAANKAADAEYLGQFQKAYTAARASHGNRPLTASQPPFDVMAKTDAVAARKAAFASCDARRTELRTVVTFMQCRMDAFRDFAVSQKLRDFELNDAFRQTILALASDYDLHKVTPQQFASASLALGTAYDGAMGREYVAYLVTLLKSPKPGGRAPFDTSALPEAEAVAKEARKACAANAEKNVGEFLNCAVGVEAKFNAGIKMQDKTLTDAIANTMREGGADASELPGTSEILHNTYVQVIQYQYQYQRYVGRQYSDLFNRFYDEGKVRQGKLKTDRPFYDLDAYRKEMPALDQAVQRCAA